MTIVSSGTISINSLVGEYGGSTPHSMNEYYKGGSLVLNHSNNANVPTSGTIQLDDFYGQSNAQPFDASIAGTAGTTSFGGKDFTNSYKGVNRINSGGIGASAYGSWSDDDFTNPSNSSSFGIQTLETITSNAFSGVSVKIQLDGDLSSSSSFSNATGWRYVKLGTTIIFDSNDMSSTGNGVVYNSGYITGAHTTFQIGAINNSHSNLMPSSGTFTATLST